MGNNFLDNWEVREVGAPIANASNTDSNSDRIDMTGYEEAVFIGSVTDSAATGVGTLKVEQNNADSDTGMAALSGDSAAATCVVNDDLNDELLIVAVKNPVERYIQAVRTSVIANIAFGSLIVLLKPKKLPPTEHSTVLDSAEAFSPAEA